MIANGDRAIRPGIVELVAAIGGVDDLRARLEAGRLVAIAGDLSGAGPAPHSGDAGPRAGAA